MSEGNVGDRLVLLGTVVRAHGVAGEVAVRVDDDSLAQEFQTQKTLWVEAKAFGRVERHLEGARITAKGVNLKIEGVDDRDEADKLRGARLFQSRERLTTLQEGEFLTGDLIGLTAKKVDGEVLGRVLAVEGAGEVLNLIVDVSSKSDGEPLQIPFADVFIHQVSLSEGTISVTVPEEISLAETGDSSSGHTK